MGCQSRSIRSRTLIDAPSISTVPRRAPSHATQEVRLIGSSSGENSVSPPLTLPSDAAAVASS